MGKLREVPGVGTVDFPDAMSEQDINAAIQQYAPPIGNHEPTPNAEPPGMVQSVYDYLAPRAAQLLQNHPVGAPVVGGVIGGTFGGPPGAMVGAELGSAANHLAREAPSYRREHGTQSLPAAAVDMLGSAAAGYGGARGVQAAWEAMPSGASLLKHLPGPLGKLGRLGDLFSGRGGPAAPPVPEPLPPSPNGGPPSGAPDYFDPTTSINLSGRKGTMGDLQPFQREAIARQMGEQAAPPAVKDPVQEILDTMRARDMGRIENRPPGTSWDFDTNQPVPTAPRTPEVAPGGDPVGPGRLSPNLSKDRPLASPLDDIMASTKRGVGVSNVDPGQPISFQSQPPAPGSSRFTQMLKSLRSGKNERDLGSAGVAGLGGVAKAAVDDASRSPRSPAASASKPGASGFIEEEYPYGVKTDNPDLYHVMANQRAESQVDPASLERARRIIQMMLDRQR